MLGGPTPFESQEAGRHDRVSSRIVGFCFLGLDTAVDVPFCRSEVIPITEGVIGVASRPPSRERHVQFNHLIRKWLGCVHSLFWGYGRTGEFAFARDRNFHLAGTLRGPESPIYVH